MFRDDLAARGVWVQFIPSSADIRRGSWQEKSEIYPALLLRGLRPRDLRKASSIVGPWLRHTGRIRGMKISCATPAVQTSRWFLTFFVCCLIVLILFLFFVSYLTWLHNIFMWVNIVFSLFSSLQNFYIFSSNPSLLYPISKPWMIILCLVTLLLLYSTSFISPFYLLSFWNTLCMQGS